MRTNINFIRLALALSFLSLFASEARGQGTIMTVITTDTDGDGIPDDQDTDDDNDGVLDAEDKCPKDMEYVRVGSNDDGCPDPLNKKRGGHRRRAAPMFAQADATPPPVAKFDMSTPDDPSAAPPAKAWTTDTDGDGIMDRDDKCPKEPDKSGRFASDGCPPMAPPALVDFQFKKDEADGGTLTLNLDWPAKYKVQTRRSAIPTERPYQIVIQFMEEVVSKRPTRWDFGPTWEVKQEVKEGNFSVVVSTTEERKYTDRQEGGNIFLRVYPEGRGPEEVVAAATPAPPPSVASPPLPPVVLASAQEHPLPADVVDNDHDGRSDDEEKPSPAPKLAPAPPLPPPPPPPVIPPPPPPKQEPAPAPPPPKAEKPPVPATPPPVVAPKPIPPPPPKAHPSRDHEMPALSMPAQGHESDIEAAEKLVAEHTSSAVSCVNNASLRGAALTGSEDIVCWQKSWPEKLKAIAACYRQMVSTGEPWEVTVVGIEDTEGYSTGEVKRMGGLRKARFSRGDCRADRVNEYLADVERVPRPDIRVLQPPMLERPKGERGVDVQLRRVEPQKPARDGKDGEDGATGPPGQSIIGPVGATGQDGKDAVSAFEIGVNTQVKETDDLLLLQLIQARLGLGDLLYLQFEFGGAVWRRTWGFGVGVRKELVKDWLALSGVAFLRARERQWSDFETGLAAGIEVDLWQHAVLELRGELKGLKGTPDAINSDWFPLAPAATLGGFVGWKF